MDLDRMSQAFLKTVLQCACPDLIMGETGSQKRDPQGAVLG